MAYINYQQFDENQVGVPNQGQSAAGGTLAGNSATGAVVAPTANPQSQAAGSGFINLEKYWKANEGNLADTTNMVTSGANEAADMFSKDADEAAKKARESYMGNTREKETNELVTGLQSDPSSVSKNAKSYLDTGFQGQDPNEYTTPLQSQQKKVNEQLKATGDYYGRQATLMDQNKNSDRGRYTQGFAALDSFLAGADQTSRQAIDKTQGRTAEVDSLYNTTAEGIAGSRKEAEDAYNANRQRVVDTAKSEVQRRSQNELRAAQDQAAARNAANYGTYQEVLANVARKNPNADLAEFVDRGQTYGAADFLSDDQLADLEALSQISGDQLEIGSRGGRQAVKLDAYEDLLRSLNASEPAKNLMPYDPKVPRQQRREMRID